MSTDPTTFTSGNGTVAIATGPAGATATFSGAIDDLRPDTFLEPVFAHVHEAGRTCSAVVLDFRPLDFLNSNGIKCLANYVRRHMATPAAERYALTLRYTPAITWQRATLKAIGVMAKDAVTIEGA